MNECTDDVSVVNSWQLTAFVIVEVLGACTLLASAHHLCMIGLQLDTTTCTPDTRFRLTALFVFDICVCILSLIGLTQLLSGFFTLCQ